MVTDSPAIFMARIPSRAAAVDPAPTGNATDTQSSPRASKAALCSSGDSEWAMGSPITPTTVEAAVGHVGERLVGSCPPDIVGYPRPRLWARRSLACWPAKLLEKASVPSLDTTTK